MKRILFVDDDPAVLAELKSALADLKDVWEMDFVDSGPRALELMVKSSFDAIVVDAVMPGMDGAELLSWVMRNFPQTVRIIMSSEFNEQPVQQLMGLAHQYLSKNSDARALQETLERTLNVSGRLADPNLQALVSRIPSLPSVPSIYLEMLREIRKEEPAIPKLANLISQDMALTTKVLQIVNSAFFGLKQPSSDPAGAIFYLGLGMVKNIVLALETFAEIEKSQLPPHLLQRMWRHSLRTASLARQIVEVEGRCHLADDVFTGGMLHDIGKLVLAGGLPDQYQEIMKVAATEHRPCYEVEKEMLGSTHAEVGAYLLGLWGLPSNLVEGVRFHHRPAQCRKKEFGVAVALHVANAIEHENGPGGYLGNVALMDFKYIEDLGLDDRIDVWRKEGHQATAA